MSLNASGERWRGDVLANRGDGPISGIVRCDDHQVIGMIYENERDGSYLLPSGKVRTCALAHCAQLVRNVAGCAGINDGHERSSTR